MSSKAWRPTSTPREVRFHSALPRNDSGKLQRFALRRITDDEQTASAEAVAEQ
ncbi:hypothetical protein [Streptomyces sp. NBC_00568]|uniref:hypothetical protein n=1 Tax=Streptomyces sp. NBC_00568 TaxID=2975779 RepID=UPI002B1E53DA|nr:hypothetical protein [Streptomyces sp. NBC_00568]